MKAEKNTKKVLVQVSNNEILDLVAEKIKHKDLFKERNELAKKILLNTRIEAEGFPSLKDLKLD